MTLRRKLLTAFAGLALLALLAAGVAAFVSLRWQATAGRIEQHYARSLLLQRVRAETFQALKEVDDALTGDAVDARGDFERALQPAAADFRAWASLADTPRERAEVREVRAAFDELTGDARQVFALMAQGRRAEAVRLVDDELDTKDYARFRTLAARGVAADRARRAALAGATAEVRRTTQVMATVAALAVVSLALLIAAYLMQDLFRPLRALGDGLDALGRGDTATRLDAERDDEFGAVAAAFNRAAAALARRESTADAGSEDWREQPSRLALHRLAARLQTRLAALRAGLAPDALAEAETLAAAIARVAAIVYPLDLRLEPVDPAALVHDVLARCAAEIAARGVSVEVSLDPDAGGLLADRLKLREAVGEAVRNALAALPERGGRLGLRVGRDAGLLLIDIADGGRGMDGDVIERVLAADPIDGDPFDGDDGAPHVGLALARAVAEQHGGALTVASEPGRGTVVRFALPARA